MMWHASHLSFELIVIPFDRWSIVPETWPLRGSRNVHHLWCLCWGNLICPHKVPSSAVEVETAILELAGLVAFAAIAFLGQLGPVAGHALDFSEGVLAD
jgi:hypothetical protein